MNEVNKTLFIPLYGKAMVSQKQIILRDSAAERIWSAEGFPIRGKSKSKWLCYNMAMRARVFDDWTEAMLAQTKPPWCCISAAGWTAGLSGSKCLIKTGRTAILRT